MVLGCDVGKIEHANGRAIEGASSKVHGEMTRVQVSSNLRHTCLVAASRKIERKNRTTTAKVHEETRLECLHEHKMNNFCVNLVSVQIYISLNRRTTSRSMASIERRYTSLQPSWSH